MASLASVQRPLLPSRTAASPLRASPAARKLGPFPSRSPRAPSVHSLGPPSRSASNQRAPAISAALSWAARTPSLAEPAPGSVAARAATDFPSEDDEARRQQASKRVERTSKYFRRLGFLGFWGQLACSIVAAIILAFSVIMTGKPTSPVSTYLTFAGIVAGFVSVFWSFGYMRLADRLKVAVDDPTRAPPRASVVSNLKNGIVVNVLGMGLTLLGLQATVGVLVAKALTSTAPMYGAVGAPAGFNPVLALDVFLVQASGNAVLSHFLGLVFSLELLRSTTQVPPPPSSVIPEPKPVL